MMLSAHCRFLIVVVLLGWGGMRTGAQEPPAESNYIKLLKRAPEARQATIIEVIGKRGDAADLTYLLGRATAVAPAGFPDATRRLAFEALGEAASTRNLRPTAGLDELNPWIASGADVTPAARLGAIRLAGVYRSASSVPALIEVAGGRSGPDLAARHAAFDALAAIGDDPAKAALEGFATPDAPATIRAAAVAALARVNPDLAADRAAGVIAAAAPNQDLAPLLTPFLDRQGGADKLRAALDRTPPSADPAKLALRALGALGRSDEGLNKLLSRVAGIEADPQPPGPAEMAALTAEVGRQGDPARGERIFRRAELNCMKCHAIAGAAGGVGPELSALGLSSPVDYIVNSILIPDQAIKEEFQTRVVQTDDGRILQGIVVEEDDRRVVLKDAQGERVVVATSAIEDSKKGGSLMPKGLVNTLTHAEFVDLVRFLAELGRPGPYAIRPTPTIQRWRALRPGPVADVEPSAPLPAGLPTEALAAEPERWAQLYGWTSGDLPVAEVLEAGASKVGLVQGEVAVSAPGPILLRFGQKPRPELAIWFDDAPLAVGPDGSAAVQPSAGTHRVTIRVDGRNGLGPLDPVRAEVARVEGSPAQFAVVGGR